MRFKSTTLTVILACVVVLQPLSVSYGQYTWSTAWTNNGGNTIGSWALGLDKYASGKFLNNSATLFAVRPSTTWASSLYYYSSQWSTLTDNGGNGYLGNGGTGWHLGAADVYSTFPYSSQQDYLLCVNYSSRWAAFDQIVYLGAYGYQWTQPWSNGGNGWIGGSLSNGWVGGWNIDSRGPNEAYLAGEINQGTSGGELLCINPVNGWAMLQNFTSSQWTVLWNNNGNGWIGGWNMSSSTVYLLGDFDGDGEKELLCVSPVSHWASLFHFNGSSWVAIWSNNGNGYIAGWQIQSNDFYSGGKYSTAATSADELLCIHLGGPWAASLYFSGGSWQTRFSNAGNGTLGGWTIGLDAYLSSQFGATKDRILAIRRPWASILEGNPSGAPLITQPSHSATIDIQSEPGAVCPQSFNLQEAYPNPFNPSTTIRLALPSDATVDLAVYDILGRKVDQLASGPFVSGFYSFLWKANSKASGIYYVRMLATDAAGRILLSKTNKLMLEK